VSGGYRSIRSVLSRMESLQHVRTLLDHEFGFGFYWTINRAHGECSGCVERSQRAFFSR
ncbi:hypothetical protein A2U01_0086945, partial [Trifolium medium]|nr:hypothetical protein [Trifolium medium]